MGPHLSWLDLTAKIETMTRFYVVHVWIVLNLFRACNPEVYQPSLSQVRYYDLSTQYCAHTRYQCTAYHQSPTARRIHSQFPVSTLVHDKMTDGSGKLAPNRVLGRLKSKSPDWQSDDDRHSFLATNAVPSRSASISWQVPRFGAAPLSQDQP
jgi:hypothetical protein